MTKYFKHKNLTGTVSKNTILFNGKINYTVRIYDDDELVYHSDYEIANSYKEAFKKALDYYFYM